MRHRLTHLPYLLVRGLIYAGGLGYVAVDDTMQADYRL